MAINQKTRQKKLARQKKKKKQGGVSKLYSIANDMAVASHSPIHECLVASNELEMRGMGNVIISRKLPDGRIAASIFLLDIYCLGVKDAFNSLSDISEYDGLTNKIDLYSKLESIHPSCLRKLIEGGIEYAKNIGFPPHKDYKLAKILLGDIDSSVCPMDFEYGKDGKPLFISSENYSATEERVIVNKLMKTCGEGNFHYVVGGDSEFVQLDQLGN
jgi:hypothetical protein